MGETHPIAFGAAANLRGERQCLTVPDMLTRGHELRRRERIRPQVPGSEMARRSRRRFERHVDGRRLGAERGVRRRVDAVVAVPVGGLAGRQHEAEGGDDHRNDMSAWICHRTSSSWQGYGGDATDGPWAFSSAATGPTKSAHKRY